MYCGRCGNLLVEGQKCTRCEATERLPGTLSPAPSDERTFTVACHLAALAAFVFPLGNLLGPGIVWLLKRQESKAVDEHGKAALNFQLSFMLWSLLLWIAILAVGAVLIVLGLLEKNTLFSAENWFGAGAILVFSGIGFSVLMGLAALVCVVLASLAASRGELFKYPLTVKWFR